MQRRMLRQGRSGLSRSALQRHGHQNHRRLQRQRQTHADGTDTLSSIEALRFAGRSINRKKLGPGRYDARERRDAAD